MYKLIVLAAVLAVAAASPVPKPGYLHAAPAFAYAAPAIHAAPIAYAAPVIKTFAAPVVAAPAFGHPLAYHGLYGGHYF